MLTVEKLKDMQPHTIFAEGVTIDNYTGINMSNSNKVLRWVAVRGGIHDWAIYIGWEDMLGEEVAATGDKVCSKDNIRKLVPCDDEAFKMYRF
jgi:hypothetical protein